MEYRRFLHGYQLDGNRVTVQVHRDSSRSHGFLIGKVGPNNYVLKGNGLAGLKNLLGLKGVGAVVFGWRAAVMYWPKEASHKTLAKAA